MNFKAVKEPDNNPILPGLKLFWAIAISLCFGTIIVPVIGPKVFQWIIGNNNSLLLQFPFDCIMLALCVWTATPNFVGTGLTSSLPIIIYSFMFIFYGLFPLMMASFVIVEDIKYSHQSEYGSLKATLRLCKRCVITLVEPVVGAGFLVFFHFIQNLAPPSAAVAYGLKYAVIGGFFLYRFVGIWRSYRRFRKGKNGT
jgi:hypothetical protein